jgi:hypothetical protein
MRFRILRPIGLVAVAVVALTVGLTSAASAGASSSSSTAPHCNWYSGSGVPPGSGIPPWGFHATQKFPSGGSGFAMGWGKINLNANTISGKICEDVYASGQPTLEISVEVGPHISFHTHHAVKWGYAGNMVRTSLTVNASTDPACPVGTSGRITMYASYNGVRSDSMQFFFANGACAAEARLYHGPNVDAQVPPL